MDWNYDMREAPKNGRCVFGIDQLCHVVVMHYQKTIGGYIVTESGREIVPRGWIEIPPVNILG